MPGAAIITDLWASEVALLPSLAEGVRSSRSRSFASTRLENHKKATISEQLFTSGLVVPELHLLFPKQCGHTEGVLTVSVKARCSIEVGGQVCSIFSGKFPRKMVLVTSPCAFFSCKLPYKMPCPDSGSVTFPVNFHTKCLLSGIFPVNFHTKWLL